MIWAKCGAILMALSVMLGAFGAHALKARLTDHYLEVYKTAVLYHMVHAMGLFVMAWVSTAWPNTNVNLAGIFLILGIVLFSGSLYVLSITGIKWVGAITPLGGLSFIAGWLILFFALPRS